MTAVLDRPTPNTIAERGKRVVWRALRSFAYSQLIGLFIVAFTGQTLWITLVHSGCIGMLCWLFIDFGRVPAAAWKHRHASPDTPEAQSQWPGWPLMFGVIVIGSLLAFTLGSVLAEWITGLPTKGYVRANLRDTVVIAIGSLVPALVMTYWFYSRETIAAQEAAVQTAQRQAAEHQLKLLESQLEPHMLFNTLANLRVLIGVDPPRAQAMLDQLIAFLRATLNATRTSQHALSAEFARLSDYLALMKIRMGERLQYEFDLPADLATLPVPALLLQPLVENCIKHGLEPKVAGGRIRIGAQRDGHALVLRVRDTGIGLTGVAGDGTRFGLVQVRERLATLYGERATLTLVGADDADGGALATIRLPLST